MSSTIDLNLMEASIRGDSGQYSYPKFVQDQLQQNPHLNQNDAAKLWENTIQKVLLSKGTSYEKISDTQYKHSRASVASYWAMVAFDREHYQEPVEIKFARGDLWEAARKHGLLLLEDSSEKPFTFPNYLDLVPYGINYADMAVKFFEKNPFVFIPKRRFDRLWSYMILQFFGSAPKFFRKQLKALVHSPSAREFWDKSADIRKEGGRVSDKTSFACQTNLKTSYRTAARTVEAFFEHDAVIILPYVRSTSFAELKQFCIAINLMNPRRHIQISNVKHAFTSACKYACLEPGSKEERSLMCEDILGSEATYHYFRAVERNRHLRLVIEEPSTAGFNSIPFQKQSRPFIPNDWNIQASQEKLVVPISRIIGYPDRFPRFVAFVLHLRLLNPHLKIKDEELRDSWTSIDPKLHSESYWSRSFGMIGRMQITSEPLHTRGTDLAERRLVAILAGTIPVDSPV